MNYLILGYSILFTQFFFMKLLFLKVAQRNVGVFICFFGTQIVNEHFVIKIFKFPPSCIKHRQVLKIVKLR
jgi:hypothetical protein